MSVVYFVTLVLTILCWYDYKPRITYDNFDHGVRMYDMISQMHVLPEQVLHTFAIMSTSDNIFEDSSARNAMLWMNRLLHKGAEKRSFWMPSLANRNGYKLIHQSYHMFDGIMCPQAPFKYTRRGKKCTTQQQRIFDLTYNEYLQKMQIYTRSRAMIVNLRALMNIVHFGAFVDERLKWCKSDKVQHRTALLEVINEAQRQPKQRDTLMFEFEHNLRGMRVYYINEPMWRDGLV